MTTKRWPDRHKAEQVLNAAAIAVREALAPHGLFVRSVGFGRAGELLLGIGDRQLPEEYAVFGWTVQLEGDPSGVEVPGFGGVVIMHRGQELPGHDPLAVAGIMASAIGTLPVKDYSWLRFTEEFAGMVPFDSTVSEVLFGPAIQIGNTSWAGMVCTAMKQVRDPPSLTLRFLALERNAGMDVRITPAGIVHPVEHQEGRGDTGGPHAVPDAGSWAASAFCVSTGRVGFWPPGVNDPPIAEFVAFVVGRRLKPGARLVVPGPSAGDAAGAAPRAQARPWQWGREHGWCRFFHPLEVQDLTEVVPPPLAAEQPSEIVPSHAKSIDLLFTCELRWQRGWPSPNATLSESTCNPGGEPGLEPAALKPRSRAIHGGPSASDEARKRGGVPGREPDRSRGRSQGGIRGTPGPAGDMRTWQRHTRNPPNPRARLDGRDPGGSSWFTWSARVTHLSGVPAFVRCRPKPCTRHSVRRSHRRAGV